MCYLKGLITESKRQDTARVKIFVCARVVLSSEIKSVCVVAGKKSHTGIDTGQTAGKKCHTGIDTGQTAGK